MVPWSSLDVLAALSRRRSRVQIPSGPQSRTGGRSRPPVPRGQVAQSVERAAENRKVGGSIPSLPTTFGPLGAWPPAILGKEGADGTNGREARDDPVSPRHVGVRGDLAVDAGPGVHGPDPAPAPPNGPLTTILDLP